MREIKFRAWFTDHNGSSMHYNIQRAYDTLSGGVTDEDGNDIGYGASCFNDYLEPDEKDKSIVMQFTGLKDKTGKEIYEGDIVDHGTHLGVVRWIDKLAAFDFRQSLVVSDQEGGLTPKDFEVVGNLYENPELLK